MGNLRMRVYYGPEPNDSATLATAARQDNITVRLADICELLADAAQTGRTWLRDFDNDEITISSDLYDVLMAYRFYRNT